MGDDSHGQERNRETDQGALSRRDFQKLLGVSGAAVLGGVSLAGCQGETSAALACPYCDSTFESESALKDHLVDSHEDELRAALGDGPYPCPYGDQEFDDLETLRNHLTEAHADEIDPSIPNEWDVETDVVVVGYGGAGVTAAIEALDNGAEVLALEKRERGGGSTAMSGGLFMTPSDESSVDGTVQYVMECSHGQVSESMARTFANEAVELPSWMESFGITDLVVGYSEGYHSNFEGYQAITSWIRESGGGAGLFNGLANHAEDLGVEVRYNAPVDKLYTNSEGRVLGVHAAGEEDADIRATGGVVLTCGGIDYAEELKKQYFRAWPKYSVGNPGNTGDAVYLAGSAGAELWKLPENCGNYCHKFPEEEIAYYSGLQGAIANRSAFIVDSNGNRFADETQSYDAFHKELNDYDAVADEFPNIPSYVIFDETTLNAGPIGYGPGWSGDNQEELEKGWIVEAGGVRELADEIGVDPDQFEETLEQFNSRAEEGSAEPFGRSGKQSLDTPPIYAIKGYPGTWGTWGGPRIDTNAQVQDTNGESVPGLYAAGNASAGVLKFLYPIGGASIGDAFAFGRIAGREAASE